MLARSDVAAAVMRLVAAYGPPFGNDPDAVVREWHRALERRGDAAALDAAVSDVVGEATKWPTVAQLRAAMDSRMRARHITGSSPAGPDRWPVCPLCRAEYFYAGYEGPDGRVVPRMRCRCAKSAASHGWRTPAARAWQETHPEILKHLEGRGEDRIAAHQGEQWRAIMGAMEIRAIPSETDPAVIAAREAKRAALLRSIGDKEAA